MPDEVDVPADRLPGRFELGWFRGNSETAAAELWEGGRRWRAPESGVGPWTWVDPVPYCPYVEYRGRVLWHHLSDAHDVASSLALRRGCRHKVEPRRIPGHDHIMWHVKPLGEHEITLPEAMAYAIQLDTRDV